MRKEQRELSLKCDEGFERVASSMAAHELEDTKAFAAIDKRITPVENMRRAMRWLGATVVVALVGGFVTYAFSHIFLGVKP